MSHGERNGLDFIRIEVRPATRFISIRQIDFHDIKPLRKTLDKSRDRTWRSRMFDSIQHGLRDHYSLVELRQNLRLADQHQIIQRRCIRYDDNRSRN